MVSRSLPAFVLSPVAVEDLDSLQPVLERRGFDNEPIQAASAGSRVSQLLQGCDLRWHWGGPISVYDCADYLLTTYF